MGCADEMDSKGIDGLKTGGEVAGRFTGEALIGHWKDGEEGCRPLHHTSFQKVK